MRPEDIEREIEIAIVQSFGWAIIEFEAVLYQKFLVMSAVRSLMTEDRFRKHLKNMEAKGYLAPVSFQGKRAWKRLVIESEMEEEKLSPEEVKAILDKAKTIEISDKKERKPKGESVVSETKNLAENILRYLEMGMPSRINIKPRIGEPTILDHVEAMHHSLVDSEHDFLIYVRKHFPRVYEDIEKLLKAKGQEVLLRSLRVLETEQRMYSSQ
jgi:hypothetical protein